MRNPRIRKAVYWLGEKLLDAIVQAVISAIVTLLMTWLLSRLP